MRRNDLLHVMTILFLIGCLATTECRLRAAGRGISDGQTNTTTDGIVVNSTAIGESKRNAIFCSLKGCTGNGGELYKCYCCVKPGLTCFPSADDCEFYCH
ncbi:hypothetical protein VPH35_037787 [Triticum aestivum]